MQHAWLAPVSVAAIVAIAILTTRTTPATGGSGPDRLGPSGDGTSAASPDAPLIASGREPLGVTSAPSVPDVLTALEPYVDPDFGFTVAVPAGWNATIVPETDAELAMLEPGYAVAFESAREHARDVFTDYLMIEILPGDEAGLFETDGRLRRATVVDGRPAWRDALTLPADPADARAVDLVVRQASLSGLGYTIGFYAVAEPARAALIEDAFEAMLRTFKLPRRPFDVS